MCSSSRTQRIFERCGPYLRYVTRDMLEEGASDLSHLPPLDAPCDRRQWIVVPCTDQGVSHAQYFRDLLNCNSTFCRNLGTVSFVEASENYVEVHVTMTRMSQRFGMDFPSMASSAGSEFVLFKRYLNVSLVKKALGEVSLGGVGASLSRRRHVRHRD